MRRKRVIGLAVFAPFALALAAAAGGVAWAATLRLRDPLDALRRDPVAVRVLHDSSYAGVTGAGEPRVFRDLTLGTDRAGVVRFTTSRPAARDTARLPLIVILAGLRTGRASLDALERHGPNLLVGYEYPYSQETWYQSAKVTQLGPIRRAVLNVPWQVAHVAERLRAGPGVDTTRTALLGFSFGALFLPATQRLAAERGHPFHAAVLAYGGTDIQGLLEANLHVGPRPLRRGLGWLGASLLDPVEPAHHLPHIPGRFLVIRGSSDQKIPDASSARLAELTPEPRTVVTLDTRHMHPRDRELTARIAEIAREWLVGQGVIEE